MWRKGEWSANTCLSTGVLRLQIPLHVLVTPWRRMMKTPTTAYRGWAAAAYRWWRKYGSGGHSGHQDPPNRPVRFVRVAMTQHPPGLVYFFSFLSCHCPNLPFRPPRRRPSPEASAGTHLLVHSEPVWACPAPGHRGKLDRAESQVGGQDIEVKARRGGASPWRRHNGRWCCSSGPQTGCRFTQTCVRHDNAVFLDLRSEAQGLLRASGFYWRNTHILAPQQCKPWFQYTLERRPV